MTLIKRQAAFEPLPASDLFRLELPKTTDTMNAIPVIGWILSLVFNISTAVPFWIVWTACGLGKTYFYWLPPVYQEIPFWHCVGLFTVIGILLRVLTPKFATISQTAEKSKA